MSGPDPYAHAIRQAAHDAARALVLAEAGSVEGLVALRDVVSWLARCYGPDALRDLAEELAADLVDALQVLAANKGLTPPEMLDDWFRDEPERDFARPITAPQPVVQLLAPTRPRSRRRPRSRWW
jgi:hypothetical protein